MLWSCLLSLSLCFSHSLSLSFSLTLSIVYCLHACLSQEQRALEFVSSPWQFCETLIKGDGPILNFSQTHTLSISHPSPFQAHPLTHFMRQDKNKQLVLRGGECLFGKVESMCLYRSQRNKLAKRKRKVFFLLFQAMCVNGVFNVFFTLSIVAFFAEVACPHQTSVND